MRKILFFLILAGFLLLPLFPPNIAQATVTTNCTYSPYSYSFSCNSYDPNAAYLRGIQLDTQAKILEMQLKADIAKIDQGERERKAQLISSILKNMANDVAIAFNTVFGRQPYTAESNYWTLRMYKEGLTAQDIANKMIYYKSLGKTKSDDFWATTNDSTSLSKETQQKSDSILNTQVPVVVARIFKTVYGREITPSESTYWKSRARGDKTTELVLKGAMAFHNAKGITH